MAQDTLLGFPAHTLPYRCGGISCFIDSLAEPDSDGVRLCALLGKYVGMKKAVLWGHFMQRQRKVTIWARVQPLPGLKVVSEVPLVTPLATAHSTASA